MPVKVFLMAAGGTGGHVIPALAVARELRQRGHMVVFIGTERGVESRLAPRERFPLELIRIGGLKRVGVRRAASSLAQLPLSIMRSAAIMRAWSASAVFSMGGYVAGPPVLAAVMGRMPVVLMEPNAVPGFTNRRIARYVSRALINFPETSTYFPEGKSELTGLPVREEFFALPPKARGKEFAVLITGGSQGSRTLNQAARESWPFFRESGFPVRFLLQTGQNPFEQLKDEFAAAGIAGDVQPFIDDMPAAFAAADLVVCRSGAGAAAELAAAAKPSVLVPFPFAADQHQLRNAEAFERAGAALLIRDDQFTGRKLFKTVTALASHPDRLEQMAKSARSFARPGAAKRVAEILEEAANENLR